MDLNDTTLKHLSRDECMRLMVRIISGQQLGALTGTPAVVAGGNFANPWCGLSVLDAAVGEYRLFALNAQPGMLDRDGVMLESPFVGPGIQGTAVI